MPTSVQSVVPRSAWSCMLSSTSASLRVDAQPEAGLPSR
jgi:hypothetical protein